MQYVRDCHQTHAEAASNFLAELDELGRKLNRLLQSVESEHRTGCGLRDARCEMRDAGCEMRALRLFDSDDLVIL